MLQVKSCLQLKVGAQVMLLQSLKGKEGLVNGSRGRVIRFAGTTNTVPVVRFTDVRIILCWANPVYVLVEASAPKGGRGI